jgi:hypothetical protein
MDANELKVTASEHAEIINLYAYYNQTSDEGDGAGFASCFTEHGLLWNKDVGLRLLGRAAIAEFKYKEVQTRLGLYRRHWNGSIHLRKVDKETVAGRCYMLAFTAKPGCVPEIADSVVYVDKIVRDETLWKFADRTVTVDFGTFKPPG